MGIFKWPLTLRGSSLKKNIFIIGLIGIFTTSFFLTYSRGGLINLLGGGCAFLFYLFFAGRLSVPWMRRRIFAAAAGLLICFLLILQTNTFFAEKFISRLQVVDHSNLGRLSVQIKGFDIWAGTDLGDGLSFVERFEDEVLVWLASLSPPKMEDIFQIKPTKLFFLCPCILIKCFQNVLG